MYNPCSYGSGFGGGIVITPVDESIVNKVFTPGMFGCWLIVKTQPGGVP